MKMNKNSLALILFISIIMSGCDNEKVDPVVVVHPLFGLWQIKTEQTLSIRKNDTIENYTINDGRYFELKKDSGLIVYWVYPNSSDKSIWFTKGKDSLYLFFDGPNSKSINKYKYKQLSESEIVLEEKVWVQDSITFLKFIYKVVRQK